MTISIRLRRWAKKSIAYALYETGLTRRACGLLRRMDSRRRLIVVAYHKVFPSEVPEQTDGMPPEIFRDQIRTLKGLFEVLGPDEAIAAFEDRRRPWTDRYPLLVTFDDGFVNNAEHALPILRQYSIPALFFLATRLIGTDGFLWTDEVRELVLNAPLQTLRLFAGTEREQRFPLPDRRARLKAASALKARLKKLRVADFDALFNEIRRAARVDVLKHHAGTRLLDWTEVRRMAACGMTIGSHSGRHLVVTRLSEEELDIELDHSQRTIEEHVGQAPRYFAYPNGHHGDFDARTAAQLARLGITHAFTMVPGIATENDSPLMLPRLCPTRAAGALLAFELLQTLLRQMVVEWVQAFRWRRPAPVIRLRGRTGTPLPRETLARAAG